MLDSIQQGSLSSSRSYNNYLNQILAQLIQKRTNNIDTLSFRFFRKQFVTFLF